jgi:hypothetical protein
MYSKYEHQASSLNAALNLTVSILAIVLLAALLVTALGDNTADCNKEE